MFDIRVCSDACCGRAMQNTESASFSVCMCISLYLSVGVLLGQLIADSYLFSETMIGVTLVLGLLTLYFKFDGTHQLLSGSFPRSMAIYDNPSSLWIVSCSAIPFIVQSSFERKAPLQSKLTWATFYLAASATLLTGFRLAPISICLPMSLVLRKHLERKLLPVISVVSGFGLTLFMLVVRSTGPKSAESVFESNVGHQSLARLGFDTFWRNPWLGNGIGSLPQTLASSKGKYGLLGQPGHQMGYYNAQNIWLHFAAELGLAGISLLFLIILSYCKLNTQSRDKYGIARNASGLSLLVIGLVSVPFGVPDAREGNLLTGCLIGLTLSSKCWAAPQKVGH
jgi:hypothetical protein